jgi:molybdopterin synthase catalytic subunit
VSFVGTVRELSHGKKVTALTYEAYEPMAKKELMRIAEEMMNRWQLCKVAIVHRTGTLSVGKISVAIVVSAPHRSDAFEAARYAIERIKEIVPIWKREHFEDGTSEFSTPTLP